MNSLKSLVLSALILAICAASDAASARGLKSVACDSTTRASAHAVNPRHSAATRRPDPAPTGLITTTAHTAVTSHGSVARALDPVVDPLLESTTTAAGTAAGTAIGIGLYPATKILEHLY